MDTAASSHPGTPEHVFSWDEQREFCELSRDHNPLHADPVAARRLLYGGSVVHGVHLVLWALENAAAMPLAGRSLRRLVCHFQSPVKVDSRAVSMDAKQTGEHDWMLQVRSGTSLCANILVELAPTATQRDVPHRQREDGSVPVEVSRDDLLAQTARLSAGLDPELANQLFPRLVSARWLAEAALICVCTEIVGMRCPGLHSLFSGIDLTLDPAAPWDGEVSYRVAGFDERFSLAQVNVSSSWFSGTLRAFLRPSAVAQASCSALSPCVEPSEFAGRKALVVGGSRGLGEVAAKLLAVGGADVTLTYCRGGDDAERVVADIKSVGCRAERLRLDVRDATEWPHAELVGFTDLYYFASPHIAKGAAQGFDVDLFDLYRDVYCGAFARLVTHLHRQGLLKSVLVPSSVFAEDSPPGFNEYAAAKRMAEVLCEKFDAMMQNTAFVVPRLPPTLTDQTAGLGARELPRAEDRLLPLLRAWMVKT